MSLINPNFKPKSNARCKNCNSKKVYWHKYFKKGEEKFILLDIVTDEPHRFTCIPDEEGIKIPIGKKPASQG